MELPATRSLRRHGLPRRPAASSRRRAPPAPLPPASAAAKNSGSSASAAPHRLARQPARGVCRAGRRCARRQSWRVIARRALDVERERGARARHRAAEHRARPARRSAPTGERMPGGQRDGDRLEQQVEHRQGVVGDAAVARALVAGGHPRHQQRRAAERERRRGRESSAAMPPWPSARARADDARARARTPRRPSPACAGRGGAPRPC